MTEVLRSLSEVKTLSFPSFDEQLTVFEGNADVPFEIARAFVVHANGGSSRGSHAHKECSQLLVCLEGRVDVTVDDGTNSTTVCLDNPTDGLLIPPTLWAEQAYQADRNILMVLCDRPYEAADYYRDRDVYLSFRKDGR